MHCFNSVHESIDFCSLKKHGITNVQKLKGCTLRRLTYSVENKLIHCSVDKYSHLLCIYNKYKDYDMYLMTICGANNKALRGE